MTDRSALVSLVEALGGARVLCVGDIMLDRFVHGRVERISPEAPIPVLRVEGEHAMLGGAGNVVRNLVALGAQVRFVSIVGDDAPGREVMALLESDASVRSNLVIETGRQTSIKTRFVAGTQQMMRADRETTTAPKVENAEALRTAALAALDACAIVVLSDYGKGLLTSSLIADLVGAARASGKSVIVDPKGCDYTRYRGAGVLTPNRNELAQATGMPTGSDAEIVAAARHLIATCGVDAVLATRGQDGMSLVPAEGEVTHLATEAREVFDVSGAGDTVIATFAAALAIGAEMPRAAALANVAAGIVVGKVGTAVAYVSDVVQTLHHHDLSDAEAKVLALEPALDRIRLWRRKGLKVGFTNGCFDLLHQGHVTLLARARAACDRLVVGLNTDDSVRRLNKGPERPLNTERDRAVVLGSLSTVDMVVGFDEDTPLKLIQAIQPDVLVKGADYAPDEVVGADVVKANGGQLLLVDLVSGYSTTGLVTRMKR